MKAEEELTLSGYRKVTVKNYRKIVDGDILFSMPVDLMKGHVYFMVKTDGGSDLTRYENEKDVKETIKMYLGYLNRWLKSPGSVRSISGIDEVDFDDDDDDDDLGRISSRRSKHTSTTKQSPKAAKKKYKYVLDLSPDQVVLYRYLHFRTKKGADYQDVRDLLNYIRRQVVQKRITSGTRNAMLVQDIMNYLLARSKRDDAPLPASLGKIKGMNAPEIIEKVKPEVAVLKLYIGMSGRVKNKKHKDYLKEKAGNLLAAIENLLDKKKVDKYYERELETARDSLSHFILNDHAHILPLQLNHIYGLSGTSATGGMDPVELAVLEGCLSDPD